MKRIFLALILSAIAALAADVTGEWKATTEGPNGTMTRTFSLKADGNKLTGDTTSSMFGKSTITDGKIDGDNLSFIIKVKIQDNEMDLTYKGKVISKDEIKFTVEAGDRTIEWVAKRTS